MTYIFSTLKHGLVVQNTEPWANVWSSLNKIKYSAFNDNFIQKGAKIFLSNRDISRTVKGIEIVFG